MASPLFAVSPGYYSHPKRNRSQLIGKIFYVNKLHYGLCENGELGSSIRNDDDCNENISNKQIRDYFKLLLAVRAVIVHVLDKTSLGRKFHVVVAWRVVRERSIPTHPNFSFGAHSPLGSRAQKRKKGFVGHGSFSNYY